MNSGKILLSHGSGGKMTSELIRKYFLEYFGNPALETLSDSAILEIEECQLAFTTDSYVVDPIFFPGGNIGKLAICGTVNDLSVSGAKPLFISVSFIIEEGFDLSDLTKISKSMADEAKNAGVKIVTGDTKVVNRGQCDKLFINTAGIGILRTEYKGISFGKETKPGDKILVNGYIGDHGIAILGARENIQFEEQVNSDCTSLNSLIQDVLNAGVTVKFMRDLTRGGLATVLAEMSERRLFGLAVNESEIPVRDVVKGACEIFGFDPLYLANEGKVLMVVDRSDADKALQLMKKHNDGRASAIIGEITKENHGRSVMNSIVGGKRIIDKLAGEQLPRIC